MPRAISAATTPRIAKGTEKMIEAGAVQLSYCAASTRKTSVMARAKISTASLPTCFSWNEMPVHSVLIPSGSFSSAM